MSYKTSFTASLCFAAALALGTSAAGAATTVAFDSAADCTSSDFTITSPGNYGSCSISVAPGGSNALVQDGFTIDALGNIVPNNNSFWEVAFNGLASNISIDLGDYNADADQLFLWAWDVHGNEVYTILDILASDSTMHTLSLAVSGIVAITFGTIDSSSGGLGLGGIYADNLTYTLDTSPVPVPAALPLLASGLGALGLAGWRRRKNATVSA